MRKFLSWVMVLTIWFVVDTDKLTAFRTVYLATEARGGGDPHENEKLGRGVSNVDDSRRYFGSNRITLDQANGLLRGRVPWLEVHTTPDFMQTWKYPE